MSNSEAVAMARRQDDMDSKETYNLFNVADQVGTLTCSQYLRCILVSN